MTGNRRGLVLQAYRGRGRGGREEPGRGLGGPLGREEAARSWWRSAAGPLGCGECGADWYRAPEQCGARRGTEPGRPPVPRPRQRRPFSALWARAPSWACKVLGRTRLSLHEVLEKDGSLGELGMLPFRASGCPGNVCM